MDEGPEIVQQIVEIAMNLELEVDTDDVEELIEEHEEQLTTEELNELNKMQQEEAERVLISGEEEENNTKGPMPTALIK